MPLILQNDHITLHLDHPEENYQESRFDWTGKIVGVAFDGLLITTQELPDGLSDKHGRGFYNEFGMVSPVGFHEIEKGEWFHKIGLGLLQKDGPHYDFQKSYAIRPGKFDVQQQSDRVSTLCQGPLTHGYAYELQKTISLQQNGFRIDYELKNTGEKPILTEEYVHNFIAVDGTSIGSYYLLSFPFDLKPSLFGETVNPDGLVDMTDREVRFHGTPSQPFFFSKLNGHQSVKAWWTLKHLSSNLAISETGDFETSTVNLWGVGHVISPELFVDVRVLPGQSMKWVRRYELFRH